LLHSFGQTFKPWSDYSQAIRAELDRQSPWPLDIIDYSLVTARFGDENPEAPFVDYLRAVFAKHPLDLIVSVGAPAAAFVQRNRQHLFASTPMVLTAVDQRRVQYSNITANDAAVAVRINYLSAFENILRVLPNTKDVIVVVGSSPIEKFWKEAIGKEVEPLANRINLSWTDELSLEALLRQASALPPHTAIFWELMIVDAAGVVHESDAPLTRLHAVANAPIFSYDESFFGSATVGGPLLLVADSSRQTAAVAIRILRGEKPGEIRIPPVEFASPVFDWREMRRWGISESRLPAGSEIRFRELTVWDQYRWQILLIAAALVAQSVLIGGLFYEHRRRHNSEVEARRRVAELALMNRRSAIGETSASIAHEINQPLAAITLNSETALIYLAKKAPNLTEVTELVRSITVDCLRVSQVVASVRAMFKKDTSDRILLDINQVIHEVLTLLRVELDGHGIVVKTSLAEGLPHLLAVRVQMQQVILNLIRNATEAMSSSAMSERFLWLRSAATDAGECIVVIEDSGPGIDPEKLKRIFEPFFTTKGTGMGMGLSICRSIVEAHGGRLSARHLRGRGMAFEIGLPLTK
jgi:signal transduction histidine kinase